MKKITTVLFLLLGLIGGKKASAQMGGAQKITWDVDVDVDVKASKSAVWGFLNNNEVLQSYSNGYIKSIRAIDESREIIFTNGKKRSETIVQTDGVNKFMVIKVNKVSLPKGIKNVRIGIFTKDKGEKKSNIHWVAKIEGGKSEKQILMKQLKAEFDSYVKGFSDIKNGI
ncbi:hypothetical protein [Flavivirga spongiicola]|uniref:SRPBCC family protein n=1 Tax=Flavivirga spongiicola TaxID=421621 RepID=A0ABU7XZS6_9FLAO|nr:hypothetical protein [Flavivirga sp. MEBiC05379]MDO5980955.1 hypothetical protein [Flavivirga sp. MEBiC05379]